MSLRYMVTGSSMFSPAANAAVGAVGVNSTSHFSKACLKSRAISARISTCWARLIRAFGGISKPRNSTSPSRPVGPSGEYSLSMQISNQ